VSFSCPGCPLPELPTDLLSSTPSLSISVFRFVSTALLTVFSAAFLLLVNASLAALFVALTGSIHGTGGVICLMLIYSSMAIMYPVIFGEPFLPCIPSSLVPCAFCCNRTSS
jgi:hypothetical protein